MANYNPKLWGKNGWEFMEYIALGYPDEPSKENKTYYSTLFKMFEHTIPCEDCRKNYKIHLQETPIENYLTNSHSLYEWVIIMKRKTNRIIGKNIILNVEKERTRKFKHNITFTYKKPCCGSKKYI